MNEPLSLLNLLTVINENLSKKVETDKLEDSIISCRQILKNLTLDYNDPLCYGLYQVSLKLWNSLVECCRRQVDLGENRDVRLRHIVCTVLRLLPDEETYEGYMGLCEKRVQLFKFLTRTGKLWSDTIPPNILLAKECWECAREIWDVIHKSYISQGTPSTSSLSLYSH
eukprot:TRINITY_DN2076_c0_g1_i18.p1 TRINITY_DN2076_c0_g1~~TRINITY_DN2076_c0_g1_i18.p1  ORF type:complete len:169 (+),score=20.28 TRINITY_DN2076_c0_g1_i18:160-666(+)